MPGSTAPLQSSLRSGDSVMTQEEQKKINELLDYQERVAEIQRHLYGKGRSWRSDQAADRWSRKR